MAELQLVNVCKTFEGGVQAVRDLSLDVRSGEFLALVGPSGCGKSTTLRMIAGLDEPTSGTIRIGDRIVNGLPPKDRDIAMVFQNYALYPHMTAYENLAFSLKLRHMVRKEIDARVRKAAAILEIEPLVHRKPKELSGGQRQRVAVGRAIVRQPQVFLFDEPLSNLDAKLRVEMRAELKKLHRQLGTTTVYVTHDQEEAMTLGDRLVVMKDGLAQQADTPLEIYNHPVNRFVAAFVGTPPMNMLSGRLARHEGALVFEDGAARIELLPEQGAKLSAWEGRQVVLGVRPEAMALRGEGRFAGRGNVLSALVSVVEPLGEKMDVYTAKHRPWRIETAVAFRSREKAAAFETYLKSGSGREFARRHF